MSRPYLRARSLSKVGPVFFARKGKKSSGPGAPRGAILTGSGRSDSSCCAGTGRGTGFSGPNKELAGRKKEALRGAKGSSTASRKRYSQFQDFFLQAPARRSCDGLDFGPLWGRKTNTGAFTRFPTSSASPPRCHLPVECDNVYSNKLPSDNWPGIASAFFF